MFRLFHLFENKYEPIKRSSSFKDFPEWAIYPAFAILVFVIFLLIKGRKTKNH
jgi:hypothetical protein